MIYTNTLQLISEPSLLRFVEQPDHVETLCHSLVESERAVNVRRFGRVESEKAPQPRYLSGQDELDSFSTRVLDQTRNYFNRPDVAHPSVLFSDNAIDFMKEKYAMQGRRFFWPMSLVAAGGLATIYGMDSRLVAGSLVMGVAAAEVSAILRTMALSFIYNLESLAGAMQDVGPIPASYDRKNKMIVFYTNPTLEEAHLMLAHEGTHHLQPYSPLLSGLINDKSFTAFREGMAIGYEYSVARQLDDAYQMIRLINHCELIAGLLRHLIKTGGVPFLSLRFGARDVLKRINGPVSLPHALGYGAFYLAEQKHGSDIYRKVFDGDVSFLQTT